MAADRILLGVIGRPHGVRGLVHVTSHTANPTDLTAYGPLSDSRGRCFTLRWRGEGLVEVEQHADGARIKVADRAAAEELTNTRLYVERAVLPTPGDDEFYLADLVGLNAMDTSKAQLGTVAAVHDYGGGTSLEIARPDGPSLFVPFTRRSVPVVDVGAGWLVVDKEIARNAADGDAAAIGSDAAVRHTGAANPRPRGSRDARRAPATPIIGRGAR